MNFIEFFKEHNVIKLMRYFVVLSVVVALSGCDIVPLKKKGDKEGDEAQ